MLHSIDLEDFKSYAQTRLCLAPLTVLIGANASGKSNAIEALRLLSWIAQGNRLGTIRHSVQIGDAAMRGTIADLSRDGHNRFKISANLSVIEDYNRYAIAIERDDDDELHVVDERIISPLTTVPLFEVVSSHEGAGNDLRVAYNNFARGGRKPQVICTDQMAVILQMQSATRFAVSDKSAESKIPRICREFQRQMANFLFLDPQPALMRDYSFASETRISGDGRNLSGALFSICSNPEGSDRILELIRSLPEQNIKGIEFIRTPRGEVMIALRETFGDEDRVFDATLLSDGTLRVLSIAAAIYTAPAGSLVVIEEIDNGVHPSRAGRLLHSISEIAKQRQLSILLSSHNPAMLDALPIDAVPHVVFCYRDPRNGASRLIRLQDIPDYPELIAQGSVGHLMTTGLIERFVKNHPGPEVKRRRSLEWLETIRRRTAHQ